MIAEFWGIEFKKRKNSTKIPDFDGVKKEVVIKGNFGFENQFQSTKCSTIAPSFFVTGASGYGYCKVWNNYYWITNISFDIDGAEYINCMIDVLASWRNFISESKFHIERCADSRYYNTDIFDSALSIEDGSEVTSHALTVLFQPVESPAITVSVMGRNATGVNTYIFDTTETAIMGELFNSAFGVETDNSSSWLDTLVSDIGNGLVAFVKGFVSDPSKYVIGCKLTPFPKSWFRTSSKKVYIGWWDTGITRPCLDIAFYNDRVALNKPSSIYADFRRTDARCSSYTIYFPGVGTVDLSPDIMEFNLEVEYTINQITGDIHYILLAGGSGVGTYDGNIYGDYGFASAAANSGAIIQTAGGVGVAASGLPYKDFLADESNLYYWEGGEPITVAAGLITAIHGAGEAFKPQASLASPNGGSPGIFGDAAVRITCTQKHTGEFLTDDYGRPCCKNLKLGDLEGFVKCSNASIEIAASVGIREEINKFLNTGFFME